MQKMFQNWVSDNYLTIILIIILKGKNQIFKWVEVNVP